MSNPTFSSSVRRFKSLNKGWLTDHHLPLIVSLEKAAAMLDAGDDRVGVLTSFRQTYSALVEAAPKQLDADDDDDLLTPGRD